MCARVSEDSIWTVPSLPVGKGTTWLSVNRSLTSDLLGSHTRSHTYKPRYLRMCRYGSALSPTSCPRPHGEREEARVTVRRGGLVFSGCKSEFGINSGFSKPMCHPAGETTHAPPVLSMSSNRRSQWPHELGGKKTSPRSLTAASHLGVTEENNN